MDSITVASVAPAGSIVGSPVQVVLVAHATPPPYLRCDSANYPASSVAPAASTLCRIYGMAALPGDRRVTTWTNDTTIGMVTGAVPEDTVGATLAFQFTADPAATNISALIGVSVSGASVAMSPATVDITGVAMAAATTAICSPPFQPLAGYMVRGDTLHCVIRAANTLGPVRALFADFSVDAGVGASIANVVGHDGGRRLSFDIVTPLDGRVYDIAVVIAVVAGPDAGGKINGPGVRYLLTDISPPAWLQAPALHSIGRGTATLAVFPSEPCQV